MVRTLCLLALLPACHKAPTQAQVVHSRLGKLDACTRAHLGTHRGESIETAKAACLVTMITAEDSGQ